MTPAYKPGWFERATTGDAGEHLSAAMAVLVIGGGLFLGLGTPADAAELFSVNLPACPEDLVWQVALSLAFGIGGAMLVDWKARRNAKAISREPLPLPANLFASAPAWRRFGIFSFPSASEDRLLVVTEALV